MSGEIGEGAECDYREQRQNMKAVRRKSGRELAVKLAAAGAAALVLGAALAGCGGEPKEKKMTIAVSTIGPTHAWAEGVLYYAQEELKQVAEENDWDYVCVTGDDSNEQSRQVVELVEQGVDCIVMLPMDGASLKTAAIAVQREDIPLVIFDREIPDFAPSATVKGDNPGIGIETAKFFNNYFPDGTVVLELMGDTSTVPFQRTDGFDETINDNFEKIQVGYTGWQREDTQEMFRDWIKKQPAELRRSVGAVFTHDDEIALGILDVLDEYRKKGTEKRMFPNLKVIAGSSGSQEMYRRIQSEEDYVLFSMSYWPQMIKRAVRTGESILKGESYEEMTIVPTIFVGKSQVEQYIDEELPF